MFALTKSMSYYLSPGCIDMRKGIYSLYKIVKSELKRNPLSGGVFIFLGKNRRCRYYYVKKTVFCSTTRDLKKGRPQFDRLTDRLQGLRLGGLCQHGETCSLLLQGWFKGKGGIPRLP